MHVLIQHGSAVNIITVVKATCSHQKVTSHTKKKSVKVKVIFWNSKNDRILRGKSWLPIKVLDFMHQCFNTYKLSTTEQHGINSQLF